mgnify:CR=1
RRKDLRKRIFSVKLALLFLLKILLTYGNGSSSEDDLLSPTTSILMLGKLLFKASKIGVVIIKSPTLLKVIIKQFFNL